MTDSSALKGKVEKFEDKMAIIIADGNKFSWPIKNLPEDIEVGSEVRLILTTTKTDEEEREKMAKTILNQVLKTNERPKE